MVSAAVINIVKFLASMSSLYLFASPFSDIRAIQATKVKHSRCILPLTSMFCNAICWCLYGILAHNIFPLLLTNAIGIIICTYYLVIFSRYASNTAHVRRCLIAMAVALTIFFSFCLFVPVSHATIQSVVGYAGISVCTVMFASPLAVVKKVIAEKSSDVLPFPMILAAFMNSISWLVYGLMLHDIIVILPNLINFVLAGMQLSLFAIYPRTKGYISMHSSVAIMDAKIFVPLSSDLEKA
uniref:Sugar transporter SWEET1 n=1 Tax=Albugo laibachii Nc14 TaxID=890382 RepID=F0WD76_9STRA|nr:MtN3like protein putative [Albugo laibachii Nc14]|eukprot:CCA19148.1 MtN3like protein putative [Albugo laibachii Nc14]